MIRRMAVVLATVAMLAGACGGDDDGSSEASAEFCDAAEELVETDLQGALGSSDPAEVEAAFTQLGEVVDRAQASAPSDLADDVDLVAESFELLIQALEDNDYNVLAAVGALQNAEIDQEATTEAQDRLVTYAEDQCGIDAPDLDEITPDEGEGDEGEGLLDGEGGEGTEE